MIFPVVLKKESLGGKLVLLNANRSVASDLGWWLCRCNGDLAQAGED
jgi:hypothetical protein